MLGPAGSKVVLVATEAFDGVREKHRAGCRQVHAVSVGRERLMAPAVKLSLPGEASERGVGLRPVGRSGKETASLKFMWVERRNAFAGGALWVKSRWHSTPRLLVRHGA
ncbi:hypothetical protein MAPG_10367 [Magnaporthiopsis poae ATCC 64411]|uniref:Uncharacterized protein n=1 Tax=Magnaporthiopsis poae (strain ATCC 64411 / 73-15) TaxID=644358 RepID=A0A0C4ECE6_MAGP6|nr:hypothetical protein MAPG_10367 [Magnaporthiopsis poae ATCC 64411]